MHVDVSGYFEYFLESFSYLKFVIVTLLVAFSTPLIFFKLSINVTFYSTFIFRSRL